MISVIIPAYNEEKIIGTTIDHIQSYLESNGYEYELIIANDGSTDRTAEIAKMHAGQRTYVFNNDEQRTRRKILNKVIPTTHGEIVVFMDADLSTDLSDFGTLVSAIKNGADIATGSRWLKGSVVKRSIQRKFISYVYNKIVAFLFSTNLTDHVCGFKAFKRDAILKIITEMGLEKNNGLAWDAEVFIRARRAGMKIVEIPIKWTAGRHTNFSYIQDIPATAFYLLKLFVELRLLGK
ncbi:MAG: glycosyltransferase [Candidatus Micrarchaeia archaeon]